MMAEPDDEYGYATSVESSIAIIRAMERIHFREKLRLVMPLLAKELVTAGVDFSKVDYGNITEPTDDELDAVYEDLRR